jgi:O-antigen ligase
MVSEWLGIGILIVTPDQYLEGSPLDRAILGGLLAAAATVLALRWPRSVDFVRANGALVLFLSYGAASVFWSDFPWIAFKRWTRAAGNAAMVLVVLTDPQPAEAIRRFFARVGFLLIPTSVLVIASFPHLGRAYHWWTGQVLYTGVATDKNGLGGICLVTGLAALWRLVEGLRQTVPLQRLRESLPAAVVVGLVLWLFYMADSSTAVLCFLLGSAVILLTTGRNLRAATAHCVVGALAVVALGIFLIDRPYEWVVRTLGEDSTLTGRTHLWSDLMRVELNPWLGTGFETFWLGDRARVLWERYPFRPRQAHNGYLETYLTLGWVGVVLLAVVVIAGYRHVIDGFRRKSPASPLKLAFLFVALAYNFTEAAFKVMHPVWIAFLLAAIDVPPKRSESEDLESRAAEA